MVVGKTDEVIKRWGQGCDGEVRVGLRRGGLEMGAEGARAAKQRDWASGTQAGVRPAGGQGRAHTGGPGASRPSASA